MTVTDRVIGRHSRNGAAIGQNRRHC